MSLTSFSGIGLGPKEIARRLRNLDDDIAIVTVDLNTARASLTSVKPGTITSIRAIAIPRITSGAEYDIRISYKEGNADFDEDNLLAGDSFDGLIDDVLVQNAQQAATTIDIIFFGLSGS